MIHVHFLRDIHTYPILTDRIDISQVHVIIWELSTKRKKVQGADKLYSNGPNGMIVICQQGENFLIF